jgi:hypothetical protein
VSGWEVKAGSPQYVKGHVDLDEYCCQMFEVYTDFEYKYTLVSTHTLGIHTLFKYIHTFSTNKLGVRTQFEYIHNLSTNKLGVHAQFEYIRNLITYTL